jgi:glutathione S-transferase
MAYILYGDKGSGASAVEMALAEAGADYAFKPILLEKNEQKSKAFLKINPSGKMPALKLPDGAVVTESSSLLVTVAERHPRAKLLPKSGSDERAQALRWLAFMASEIYPMVEIVDYPDRFVPAGKPAEALKDKARERIRERILIAQKAIEGPWFLGPAFSVVDIYAVMFSRWSVGREWRDKNLKPLVALSRRVSERPKIAPVWQKHFPNPI